jgi:hypothetical protein
VKKENVKINKMSGKKGVFIFCPFLSFWGAFSERKEKKDIIKEKKRKGRNAITWEFPVY